MHNLRALELKSPNLILNDNFVNKCPLEFISIEQGNQLTICILGKYYTVSMDSVKSINVFFIEWQILEDFKMTIFVPKSIQFRKF